MYEETTIAAIATSPGEGGIGIIRISGMQAADVADRVFHTKKIKSFHEAEPYRMYFGRVMEGDRQVDEGLAVYMRSPHSYTGEDVVEIQIHGSMEALRQTLSLVLEKGAVPAHRGEFTKRAFLNGRLDLSQAEAVMDIIEAKGAAALSQAESHLSGALSSFVRASRDQLKDLIAKLEVTIDYPEEDLEDLTNEEIEEGLSAIDSSLRSLLSRSEEGRIIRDGLRTAIVGRPNAGKSSLLNALLQEERAIVTDIPGTTRDTIEESIKIGGVPLILMDTAGIRETENKIERIGIERAKKSMEKADLIMAVIDGSRPLSEEDRALLNSLFGRKALVILNKYDLPQEIETRDVKALAGDIPVVPISARYGSGIAELEEELHHITRHQDVSAGRELFLTNLRHVDLVKKALAAVRRAEAAGHAEKQHDHSPAQGKNIHCACSLLSGAVRAGQIPFGRSQLFVEDLKILRHKPRAAVPVVPFAPDVHTDGVLVKKRSLLPQPVKLGLLAAELCAAGQIQKHACGQKQHAADRENARGGRTGTLFCGGLCRLRRLLDSARRELHPPGRQRRRPWLLRRSVLRALCAEQLPVRNRRAAFDTSGHIRSFSCLPLS